MPLKSPAVWDLKDTYPGCHEVTNTKDNIINQIIEKLTDLRSRKRLDTIQEVEQENLKFNRALRKLYNKADQRGEKQSSIKAKRRGQGNCGHGHSQSDRILQGLHAVKDH